MQRVDTCFDANKARPAKVRICTPGVSALASMHLHPFCVKEVVECRTSGYHSETDSCTVSKAPNGPTVKMHLQNLHTMEELNFIGNCLKGSRPVLSFDAAFEKQAHTRLLKEMLTQIFGVPKSSRRVKPFVDHVMGFTLAGGKIWVRVFQINESEPGKKKPVDGEEMEVDLAPKKKGKTELDVQLVEIGPRFVLTPIVIQESSFGGPIIYENKEFVSPNQIRADLRRTKAGKYNRRTEAAKDNKIKRGDLGLTTHGGRKKEKDPLSDSVLFA